MIANRLTHFFSLALVAAGLLVASCGDSNNDRMSDRADTAGNNLENGMERAGDRVRDAVTNDEDADQNFLEKTIKLNTEELRALRLGQQKGGAQVKKHMSHMIADHRKMAEEVQRYIANKNLTLDDVDTANTDNRLADNKPGADWDRDFADMLVRDHEKTIDHFEEGQKDVKDPDLRAMIEKNLPTLRAHLDMARDMQGNLNQNR